MRKVYYTYLATADPNRSTPYLIKEMNLKDKGKITKITVNVFDDVDGTAGIKFIIGTRLTIPSDEVGDGWISGDNTTLTLRPELEIGYNEPIQIVGKNTHDTTPKHFFIMFEVLYDYEPTEQEG